MTRLIYVLVLVLCISTSFTLYILSYDSKNIKKEIIQIRNTIEAEKSDIETLHAELSLLSQPDRIQNLSNQFGLDLEPVEVTQIKRIEDIPLLIDYFIENICKTYNYKLFSITDNNYLLNYNWPGNVRELENTLQRALVLCRDNIIDDTSIMIDKSLSNINENSSAGSFADQLAFAKVT